MLFLAIIAIFCQRQNGYRYKEKIMSAEHEYSFSDASRKAYEMLLLPMGVYQLVGDKIRTLLVSDGLCSFYGRSREDLVQGFNKDMFANVHPDDVETLAKLGLRYATQEGPYDIIYRSRLPGSNEYRYVHAVSKFHGMEDGSRVAFTMYSDITGSLETKKELEKEFNSPAVNFLNENIGPMAVVARTDHRILFYNNAIFNMLKPEVHYDSGLRFEEFFCHGDEQGFEGLFDEIDGGLQTVTEPATGRRLAANVIACTWENEPAYAVFLYEDAEEKANSETAERRKRVAFNNVIFSGNYNGLEYYENGYRGMWLWNLTQNKMVAQSGHTELMHALGEEASFDRVISGLLPQCEQAGIRDYLKKLDHEECISRFRKGTLPQKADIRLNTPKGQVMLHLDVKIMQSPVDGDLYLKVAEENITDLLETNDVLWRLVDNQYDFIAYIDVIADHCRIIDGNTVNRMQKDLSVSYRNYAQTLAERLCMRCGSAAELTDAILKSCGSSDDAAVTFEQPDGKVKSIGLHILDRKNLQFYVSKADVTKIVEKEKQNEVNLKKAKTDAEAELLNSQENYKRTVDFLNIGMWTYYIRERKIVLGNNAATKMLRKKYGWPEAFENAPESTLNYIDEEDREKYIDMFRKINSGQDASCEVWYKNLQGSEPQCERESYHVISDRDGRPLKAYGIGMNVTAERKVFERHNREMEYLRDNSDESLIAKGHYDLTKNLVLEYDSRVSGKDIYNFSAGISYDRAYEGFLKRAYNDADRQEIADKLKKENLIRRYQQGEMQRTFQYRRSVEGQEPVWVSMTVHIYMEPATGNLELFSYAYDITRRMRNENISKIIFENTFNSIALIHVREKTLDLIRKSPNAVFTNMPQNMGYDEFVALIKRTFILSEEMRDFSELTLIARIVEGLRENGSYIATYRCTSDKRMKCMQINYTWFDEAAEVILAVQTDITESYERNQQQIDEIRKAKLESDRANDAKSVFLSSMSHDLRTPLNGVLGFTAFALRESDPEKKQEYLEKIDLSGKLLLDLVNDTLELSRIESGKAALEMEKVMPCDLIPAVITALQPSAELKNIRMIADFPMDDHIPVYCDRLKVQKIALNLISNAIKYTPEGGTISVYMVPSPAGAKDCKWSFCVEDNGIGMSEEFMKRMYEPFSQEKRSEAQKTSGTGLGLSIVKRYVDLMGGFIDVKSVLHKGTRWIVSLPIAEAPDGKAQSGCIEMAAASLSGKRVLLCEDNYMNIEIASMLLKDRGLIVETAENGEKGVEMFTASAPGYYDAILMDMRMPVTDGLEATRRIRSLRRPDAKTIRIIAMTADAFEESIQDAKNAGMDGYLTKPVEPKKLFEALAAADCINNSYAGKN